MFHSTDSVRFVSGATRCRRGLSILEILASVSILTILISFFATFSIRIQRLAKDVEKDQVTLHELANMLESEIAKRSLAPHADSGESEGNAQPEELTASPSLSSLWPRGRIVLHRSHDDLGDRLTLTHFRDSEQPDALPTSLTGWIPKTSGISP